nr:putative reverse transcriptase domain-containing protein [Tanacetum cinerariifolium]
MTRSTVKRLTKALDEPEREFQRLRKAVMRSHQNESLAIAGRNLFNYEASSSNNTGAKLPTPPKTLHEHSHPNSFGRTSALRDLIFRFKQGDDKPSKVPGSVSRTSSNRFLIVGYRIGEEEGWNRIEEYVKYQDDLWDERSPSMNVSSVSEAMKPTLRGRLIGPVIESLSSKHLLERLGLKTLTRFEITTEDPMRLMNVNKTTRPRNIKRKEKGEDGPKWIVRSKFEDELANFMLEKKSYAKGIRDMLIQHRKELREQYSQILSTINKSETPKPEASTFTITTRLGISTQDQPFPALPRPAADNFTEGKPKKKAMIHMPNGAKVLKDLLLHKEKLEKAASSVKLSEECSVIIRRSLPPKGRGSRKLHTAILLEVLQNHKGAIAWSIVEIKGIDSSLCTHKILMEDEFKPSVQPQRRVNPNIKEVVKKEVIKLLDARLLYPISNSPWIVTRWRICIDYCKLNNVTRKDQFPLPFIDLMLERLAGHEYYCFLYGFTGYFQIPIAPEDQEKTTLTCSYGTFTYKRMPFGLCNAPTTFQRCITAIFYELIEDIMEVFMDGFFVLGSSFDHCLKNLEKMLKRCEETNLVLNWEKCHFMLNEGIVLDHKSADRIIQRCVARDEAAQILQQCHSRPSGEHHGITTTVRKVFEAGLYLPHIFHDAERGDGVMIYMRRRHHDTCDGVRIFLTASNAQDNIFIVQELLKGYQRKNGARRCALKEVCLPKEQGGLGIKSLKKWNEVLLVKQLWKIIEGKESLWVKWVNVVKLKDGKKVSMLFDKWDFNGPICDIIPIRMWYGERYSDYKTAANILSNGAWVWPVQTGLRDNQKEKKEFSTKQVWMYLKDNVGKVNWHHVAWYGYCKNHRKRAKTGQKRTRERKEYTRAGILSSKVNPGQLI